MTSYSALPLKHSLSIAVIMDEMREQFLEKQIEVEIEGENFLLARHEVSGVNVLRLQFQLFFSYLMCFYLWLQLVETDRMRNANREALTALRKRAKTTKTSVPSPFESLMKDIDPRPLVKEICATCGHHNAREKTLLMFPGTDTFATIPFHAAHTILEEGRCFLFQKWKKKKKEKN